MIEINKELLELKGFKSNHTDEILNRYYLNNYNEHWHIDVSAQYCSCSCNLAYTIECVKYNNNHTVKRRARIEGITDYEDVIKICELCEINIS